VIAQRKDSQRRAAWCATLAVAALLATGCSSGKSTPTAVGGSTSPAGVTTTSGSAPAGSVPADEAAAKQQVTDLYTKYFDSTVATSAKTDLVQNGAKMNALVAALAQAAQTSKSSVKINTVSFTSPTHATVDFDILLNGAPALPHAQGQALLDQAGSKWQVADVTLCTLAGLDQIGKDVLTAAGCP
jgi:hypothetical protein